MTNQPSPLRITVVIPVRDEAEVIGACLKALQDQSRPADEIIVVDNGCRDATVAIARRFDVVVIEESRAGIWPAAAAGFDAATGALIVRIDADTVPPPDWLRRVAAHFADPGVVAVTGPGRFYGAPWVLCRLADVCYMRAYFISVAAALGGTPLFGSNFAITRRAWYEARRHAHRLRSDIHDDIDLSYHLGSGCVRYDGRLVVGISARPLLTSRGMLRRTVVGLRTIALHWPRELPWLRWYRRWFRV